MKDFNPFFPPTLQLNALANRAAGKGYENEDNYSNIRFQFVGIENIHVMRASLQKLLEGSTDFASHAGTRNNHVPFWSAKGAKIAFFFLFVYLPQ